jgi:TRAP-type mannitol/chloroaromatic compound transport system permease small subunit
VLPGFWGASRIALQWGQIITRTTMNSLLLFSRGIDRISLLTGKLVMWLVLACTVISASNAVLRKAFNFGSNAALELQWYLFAATFMLGVGYVLLKNAHVRIDFVSSRLSVRTNAIIDIVGMVVFTIPLCLILLDLSWPYFWRAFVSGEMSQNAGGLIRWPVIGLIPLGFAILLLQTLSELIKRSAYLTGHLDSPITPDDMKSAEDVMMEEMAKELETTGPGAASNQR